MKILSTIIKPNSSKANDHILEFLQRQCAMLTPELIIIQHGLKSDVKGLKDGILSSIETIVEINKSTYSWVFLPLLKNTYSTKFSDAYERTYNSEIRLHSADWKHFDVYAAIGIC